ncbi:MAG TPA: hypothetical protein DCL54_03215 [Alphaproteobacteria bacterium]|nr:hypothetical protein [Alphaproteobacteria bacterium]
MTMPKAIVTLFFSGLLLLSLFLWGAGASQEAVTYIEIWVIVAVSLIVHLAANIQRNWMRIDTVFLVSYFVVFFQWPIMHLYFELFPLHGFQAVALEHIQDIIAISGIGLIAWLIGYNLPSMKALKLKYETVQNAAAVPFVFLILLIVFLIAAGPSFLSREIYTTAATSITNTVEGTAAYLLDLLEITARLSLAVVLYIWATKAKAPSLVLGAVSAQPWMHIAVLFAFCLLFLAAGERGQVIMILAGLAIGYGSSTRPIGFGLFALALIGGFAFFSLVGILRASLDGGAQFGATFGYWELSTNLAQSFVTLGYAVEITQSSVPLIPGQVFFSQIFGIIPFGQSFMIPLLGFRATEVNSALLITHYVFGPTPHSGLGTSIVADLYLAFGLGGVCVGMVVFGQVCQVMQRWLSGDHGFMRFYTAVIFAGLAVYIVRASFLYPLKPVLWGLLFGALFLALGSRRSRS